MSKANFCIGSSIRLGRLLPILALALVFNAHAQTFTKFTTLHHFGGGGDGAAPHGTLVLSGSGTLYGTAPLGGIYKNGTVFALSTNGAGFRALHSFSGSSDGGGPYPWLLLVGDTLYGVASGGGDGGGTVFAMGTNGGGFRVLHSFSRISGPLSGPHWMVYSNVD
jgi:uncharacterized repeat protein (TIGR03803 family)